MKTKATKRTINILALFNRTFLLLLILLAGCLNSKETSKVENKDFDMSLRTIQFLNEYYKEKSNSSHNDFQPSKNLIEKYHLKKYENEWTISGFIRKSEDFNTQDLLKVGIHINTAVQDMITVIIPLGVLEEFLKIQTIKYFEISKQAQKTKL